MNNKKLTYILIPVVVVLWGLIAYKIFVPQSGVDLLVGDNYSIPKTNFKQVVDSFDVHPTYPDPFLKNVNRPSVISENTDKQNTIVSPSLQKQINKKPISKIRWPQINYSGTIKNKKSDKLLAVININNQDKLMQQGDIAFEVQLQSIENDSVKLMFANESKYILKKK